MIFIDASYYLALLNAKDNNHQKAIKLAMQHKNNDYVTSYAILGEVLTVGSQRFDKELTINFVEEILKSNTKIVLEKTKLVNRAFQIFRKIKSKNISWVDSYSFAIMEKFKLQEALTFDKDFKKCFTN